MRKYNTYIYQIQFAQIFVLEDPAHYGRAIIWVTHKHIRTLDWRLLFNTLLLRFLPIGIPCIGCTC